MRKRLTPEERALYKLEWQQKKQATFTPEQRAEYNRKQAVYAQLRRQRLTEFEKEELRKRDNEYRAELKAGMTEEEKITIRSRKSKWMASKRRNHAEEMRQKRSDYMRRHRQTPAGAIELRLRCRLRKAIARHASREMKAGSTMELVGCSREFLNGWIEAQFVDGMSWDRFGEIHIDHIRPVSAFDLTNPEQQRACFHYTNIQPLWKHENLSKGRKILPFKLAA